MVWLADLLARQVYGCLVGFDNEYVSITMYIDFCVFTSNVYFTFFKKKKDDLARGEGYRAKINNWRGKDSE